MKDKIDAYWENLAKSCGGRVIRVYGVPCEFAVEADDWQSAEAILLREKNLQLALFKKRRGYDEWRYLSGGHEAPHTNRGYNQSNAAKFADCVLRNIAAFAQDFTAEEVAEYVKKARKTLRKINAVSKDRVAIVNDGLTDILEIAPIYEMIRFYDNGTGLAFLITKI